MVSARDAVQLADRQVRQLERILHAKLHIAVQLGATEHDNSFILSGRLGGIRITVDDQGMRLFVSHVPGQHYTVDIVNGKIFYPFDVDKHRLEVNPIGDLVPFLIDLISTMAVAPQVHASYGFVNGDEIVGFVFLINIDTESKGEERDDLGLIMDTYFVRDPRGMFDFIGEKDPANWLQGFWKAKSCGQVIDLSARVRDFVPDFWGCQDGPDVWLEFDGTDAETPAFVVGQRYRSWEPLTNSFSSYERLGGPCQKNLLNGWLEP